MDHVGNPGRCTGGVSSPVASPAGPSGSRGSSTGSSHTADSSGTGTTGDPGSTSGTAPSPLTRRGSPRPIRTSPTPPAAAWWPGRSRDASAAAEPEKDRRLIGEERTRRASPYRTLLDAEVPLAFGSDYPGENTCDPLFGMHLAVNRQGGEAITPEDPTTADRRRIKEIRVEATVPDGRFVFVRDGSGPAVGPSASTP